MGARGPMPGATNAGRPSKRGATNLRQLPTVLPKDAQVIPEVPTSLRETGEQLWARLWASVPWLAAEADRQLVEELCCLADELVSYRAALAEHGALLIEPVVTTRGEVVGERKVANPAEAMARRAGRQMESIWDSIGLTPASRTRLGVSV